MTKNVAKNKPPLWAQIVAWFIVVACLVLCLGLIVNILRWLWGLGTWVSQLDSHDWAVIGDVSRNTSGWVALFAAAGTIATMYITNRSREKEAASSNFRDHLQWAVERAANNDNQFEVAFAQAVIQHFANNKPKHLSQEEHELVLEVRQTLENMQVIEDEPATGNLQ